MRTYTNISNLVNDPQFKYMCFICRIQNEKKIVKDKLIGYKRESIKSNKLSPDKDNYILSILILIQTMTQEISIMTSTNS